MKITYLGHAAIFLETRGTSILMDPWLTDGAYLGSWWHFPPLVLGIRDLPRPDVIYISHEHADHFDPATLEQADRSSRVVIANFRNKRFRDRIAGLGFRDIVELDFGTSIRLGERLDIELIAPDRVWDDSAILLRDGECTVLNVNDAHLDEATLSRLSENDIDLAFITFAGASQYPGCFELPPEEKRRRSLRSKQAHLDEFVHWAQLLKTKRVVPAAGNYALLAPDQLPLNTGDYVGTPKEALEALAHRAPEIEGIQMNPADEWTPAGGLRRANPAPDWDRRLELIDALSHEHAAEIAASLAAEKPAPADLYERFRDYFTAMFTAHPEIPRQVNLVVWWTAVGPAGGDWVIDFTRARDWIYRGVPCTWNLHITIPDRLIAAGLAEEVPWEHLVLSFRARIARNPDRYMREFWEWFGRLPGRKYLG